MKILIFGNGYIGNKFHKYFKDSSLSHKKIMIESDVVDEINKYKPQMVINCIGKTGTPNIDWCELHKYDTIFSNVVIPEMLAKVCQSNKIKMIHIGTGCIYSGGMDTYFDENDEPNFLKSTYSFSKYAAECILKNYNVLQLRIRMPISEDVDNRNLISKLLKYKDVISLPNSVTYIPDLLLATEKLILQHATGIYNVVNPGIEHHEDILRIYNRYSKHPHKYNIIDIDKLNQMIIAGRSNCLLSTSKLESVGITMKHIGEFLERCVAEYARNQEK